MSWSRQIALAGVAALIVIGFAYFGGLKSLGAHPFWHLKVALIGAPIGAILSILTIRLRRKYVVGIFGLAFVLSVFAARLGKTEFAASYAENALAGQFWFFGWIAICLSATALIPVLISARQ